MSRRLTMLMLIAALAACNGPTKPTSKGPATLTSLTISGATSFSAVGQGSQLTIFGNFSDGTRRDVTSQVAFTVQNPSVLTVSTSGAVRTVGYGSTTITATLQSVSVSVTAQVVPTVVGLMLSPTGILLSAAGQTAQLTLMANYVDGSTKDVSSDALWTASPAQVASIVAGLVTARDLGYTTISARYPANGQTKFANVAITPPGTFVLDGRTRDPGNGGLSGVTVTHQGSGRTITTPASGEFMMGGMTDSIVTFNRSGYEPVSVDTRPFTLTSLPVKYLDVAMQPVTRINAGESVTRTIAPHDMEYEIGDTLCYPCQFVRVTIPSSGTLHLDASWTETHSILHLWINGVDNPGPKVGPSSISADVPVTAGELLVYVGQAMNDNAQYVTFTITTAMR